MAPGFALLHLKSSLDRCEELYDYITLHYSLHFENTGTCILLNNKREFPTTHSMIYRTNQPLGIIYYVHPMLLDDPVEGCLRLFSYSVTAGFLVCDLQGYTFEDCLETSVAMQYSRQLLT